MKQKKENRGGYREGSGRKKSDIETTILSFRVPSEKADQLKEKIKAVIKKHFIQ